MRPVVDLAVGARPNFVKLAPVVRALASDGTLGFRIVHTGQHHDDDMSAVFFRDLGIPAPDVTLDIDPVSPGARTARILERYEAHLLAHRPAAVVVFGDVDSTLACALAAVKLGIPVAHVEAGLRSFDRAMPEEINRILTDALAGLLFVSEPAGVVNLRREGIPDARVRLVGNVMIDTLLGALDGARARGACRRLGLEPRGYGFSTIHRPSNVDDPRILGSLVEVLHELAQELPLVFAVHPRTRAAARRAGLAERLGPGASPLICLAPLPYLEALSLVADARLVLTDSGGLQEETAVLGVPCLTLRDTTERPVTVERGTSRLVGNDPERIRAAFRDALDGAWPAGRPILYWDGRASARIATELAAWLAR